MYWDKSTVIERVRNIRKRISISSSFIVILNNNFRILVLAVKYFLSSVNF